MAITTWNAMNLGQVLLAQNNHVKKCLKVGKHRTKLVRFTNTVLLTKQTETALFKIPFPRLNNFFVMQDCLAPKPRTTMMWSFIHELKCSFIEFAGTEDWELHQIKPKQSFKKTGEY